jgi:hypothetical protein
MEFLPIGLLAFDARAKVVMLVAPRCWSLALVVSTDVDTKPAIWY